MLERDGDTFIIQTDDGPERTDVYISWNADEGFYSTVDYINEIDDLDFFDTVEAALERANEVNSSTFGGWNWAPMKIMKLTNFYNAYYDNEYPELEETKVISF